MTKFQETDLRWAAAAGFSMEDMAGLTRQEMEEFDTLTFQRYGPDQVTYSDENEERRKELLQKIMDYAK